jgi:hypothetical protein
MQDFDVTLAPGQVRTIDVQADYIYYRAGSAGGADASIEFAPVSGGETVFLYPGQSYRLPPRGSGMGSAWALRNRKGEAPIIGSILMGEGAFQDNRISGSVEVVDGGKNRTRSKVAFMAVVSEGIPNVGMYLNHQIWNPAGSQRVIVLERVTTSTAADLMHFSMARSSVQVGVAAVTGPICKDLSGAPSVAQLRIDKNGAASAKADMFNVLYLPKAIAFVYTLLEPIVISPGTGVNVTAGAVDKDLPTVFEYYEEAL